MIRARPSPCPDGTSATRSSRPYRFPPDGTGLSTVGLQLIDKASGAAVIVGAGTDDCASSSRVWPTVGPFAPLAACAGWNICQGWVLDVAIDPAAAVLVVETQVVSRQSVNSEYRLRTYLVAYDMDAGARTWWTELEHPDVPDWYPPQAQWGGHTTKMVGLGGTLLAVGRFPLEQDASQQSTSSMILVDEATGSIVERWNTLGEQDPADPATIIEPASGCTPADDGWSDSVSYAFTRTGARSAVGYGTPSEIPGGRRLSVCAYTVTGTGSGARLGAEELGTLDASPDPGLQYGLPSILYGGRYLVGENAAFDLTTGAQVSGWSPSPSGLPSSTIIVGSSVVFGGGFVFLHGAAANHVAALDRDLAPIPGFVSQLADTERSGEGIQDVRALRVLDDRLLVAGDLKTEEGRGPVVSLDLATGTLEWARVESTVTIGHALAVDPATDAFYLGVERSGNGDLVTRFIEDGPGFAVDTSFSHPIDAPAGYGPDGSLNRWVTSLAFIDGRLYIGGLFGFVDGQARQALARIGTDGVLDEWAPAVLDEMAIPSDASIEVQPRAFVETAGGVVVSGVFGYLTPMPGGGGYASHEMSEVLVYSVDTGSRVRPVGGNGSWFPGTASYGAYDMALVNDTIFVAFGSTGIRRLRRRDIRLPAQPVDPHAGLVGQLRHLCDRRASPRTGPSRGQDAVRCLGRGGRRRRDVDDRPRGQPGPVGQRQRGQRRRAEPGRDRAGWNGAGRNGAGRELAIGEATLGCNPLGKRDPAPPRLVGSRHGGLRARPL